MSLFTILVMLFSTLFIEATSYEEIPSRRFFSRDAEQCPCFPQGQSLMPELSNPQDHGLERVVVYIYRNIVNPSQVYVFKPGPKSQALIPNIPYLPGDSFTQVTTETIVSLFNSYTAMKVIRPQQSLSNQGEPIGLNVGVIDVKLDNNKPSDSSQEFDQTSDTNTNIRYDNTFDTNTNSHIYNWESMLPSQPPHIDWYPSPQLYENLQNNQIQKENLGLPNLPLQPIADSNVAVDNWHAKDPHYNIPSSLYQYKPIMESVHLDPYQFKPMEHSVPSSPYQFKPITDSVPSSPYQYKPIMESDHLYPYQFKPTMHSVPSSPYQFKPITDSVLSSNYQYKPIMESDHLDPYQFKPTMHSVPSNPFQYKPTGQSVNWFQPGIIYKRPADIHQHNTFSAEDLGHKESSTFDMWFKGQVENFKDAKISESVRATDTNILRSLVRQTLSDNHIHIGHSGMLIDGNGTPIDLNNLELRPILIGSPVTLQALTHQLAFPKTLPYLEAMVILLINPFKILGIIPLGKTYIASSGKASHSLQFTGPQVYSYSNLNGNRRSFSKLPFFANLKAKLAAKQSEKPKPLASLHVKPSKSFLGLKLQEILDLKLDSSNSPKFTNTMSPLSFNEQLISNLQIHPSLALHGANRRLSPYLNSQVPNFKSPLLLTPYINPLDAYSDTDSNPQLNLTPIGSSISSSNFSPHVNNDAYLSNSNTLNIIASPTISHSSNSLWQNYPSHNHSPLLTPDSNTIQIAAIPNNFPAQEFISHVPVGSDNKETGDSNPWSAMTIPELGYYDRSPPQAQEQSSWTNGWGDAIINTLPAVLNPETSGFDITQWNNLGGTQNEAVLEDGQSIGSTRRFSTPLFKGVLKTLVTMFIQNMADKQKLIGNRRKINEPKQSEAKVDALVSNPSKAAQIESDAGGGPDFRIIGGSAATGSGSPLSNKGRSGLG